MLGRTGIRETCREDLKIEKKVPEEERTGREGKTDGGRGGGGLERVECFRVNIDKWLCRISRGSGECQQLGQRSTKGARKWGFYLSEHLREEKREGNKEIERQEVHRVCIKMQSIG